MKAVCIGEALIDFKAVGDLLFQGYLGGSPFNVAIAAARLGARVSFLSQLSEDAFGLRLRRHLETNGIDTGLLCYSSAPTTLAFVEELGGEESFQFLANGSADTLFDPRPRPRLPEDTGLIHFGSISLLAEPAAGSIVDIVRQHRHAITVFDPNVRPALISDRKRYLETLPLWLELSRVVKLSSQDLRWLDDRPVEAVTSEWFELGVEAVLVTHGSDGARAYLANGVRASAPGVKVDVVDTVGAGDTFSGALLARLASRDRTSLPEDDQEWSEMLRFAVAAAAVNCSRAGTDPPMRDEVESLLGDQQG
ncbi:MAG: carbohydrate kinase [Trueperaceae bacterium]